LIVPNLALLLDAQTPAVAWPPIIAAGRSPAAQVAV
jgi:hypothetical protein